MLVFEDHESFRDGHDSFHTGSHCWQPGFFFRYSVSMVTKSGWRFLTRVPYPPTCVIRVVLCCVKILKILCRVPAMSVCTRKSSESVSAFAMYKKISVSKSGEDVSDESSVSI